MIKVVHFVTSIDKLAGGVTTYLQLISSELNKNVELIVATGISAEPVDLAGVKVSFFNLQMKRWFRLKKEFETFFSDENPDIVHINGIWEPQIWLFQQVAQELGIKIVLSPHGMLEPYILNRHPLKKKLALAIYQHRALTQVDYFQLTAKSELDQIRKLGYTQRAEIIPNGITMADVKPKKEWKKVHNILFLSRIHPKKGIELLIEAVALLPHKTVKITVAGEGDSKYVETLKRLTVERSVSQQFDFVGGVYGNQKWELLNRADLFILPSYSENFGFVIPEALATGLPVITTVGTPWREIVEQQCGWWIELNVQSLADAIKSALDCTPDELKIMGQNAQKLATSSYDLKSVVHKMLQYYAVVNSSEKG